MKRYTDYILKSVAIIETFLAAFLIFAVASSSITLVRRLYYVITTHDFMQTYDLFQGFMAHALLLVIGLELALMLLKHTPSSIIEVLIYALARKLLIHATNAYELAVGVAALAGLFAIRKYLMVPMPVAKSNEATAEASVPAKEPGGL
ncbi:MAG: hypothetical protein GX489_06190 [Firmicutes bacterium]|jgi:hypothetical protein|nr:hypothetical protein [Bacillota bacterium]